MNVEEVDYEEVLKLRQEVMYPNKDVSLAKIENDNQGIHLGIYNNTALVSVVSIFLENEILQFRKLATKEGYQKKGYATFLIKWIISYSKEMGINKVWANSRVEVIPFYQKFGFEETSEKFNKNGYKYIIIEYNNSTTKEY